MNTTSISATRRAILQLVLVLLLVVTVAVSLGTTMSTRSVGATAKSNVETSQSPNRTQTGPPSSYEALTGAVLASGR